MVELNY